MPVSSTFLVLVFLLSWVKIGRNVVKVVKKMLYKLVGNSVLPTVSSLITRQIQMARKYFWARKRNVLHPLLLIFKMSNTTEILHFISLSKVPDNYSLSLCVSTTLARPHECENDCLGNSNIEIMRTIPSRHEWKYLLTQNTRNVSVSEFLLVKRNNKMFFNRPQLSLFVIGFCILLKVIMARTKEQPRGPSVTFPLLRCQINTLNTFSRCNKTFKAHRHVCKRWSCHFSPFITSYPRIQLLSLYSFRVRG